MNRLKQVLLAILIFVVIPASLLLVVFQLTDRNTDAIEHALIVGLEKISPDLAYSLENLFRHDDDVEDEIPLIKAQADAESNAVVVDNMVSQVTKPKVEEPKSRSAKEDEITDISMEFVDQTFSSEDILADRLNRIPHDFKVPANLRDRVAFWLDIYTKYSSRFSIVHDQDRPWIIYKIVDARGIYNGKGNIFAKDIKERKAIFYAKESVRKTLRSLANKSYYGNLKGEELKFYKLLEEVPGTRKKVFRGALKNFRVQRGQKDHYMKGLIQSSKYMSEMEEIFARYDLPIELVRLPLVESSFNEDATSKVGASGVWQFMLNVGKQYLHVSTRRDERISPIKETEAAAKLFLANHKIFKSWPLTVTSYNHGTGIYKAAKKLKTNDLAEIIERYHNKSFSFASQNFYCEFLGALYAERYQEEIFGVLAKHPALAADSIKLRKSMRVKEISEIAGVTLEEIKLHNPDIKELLRNSNPFLPVGYHIRLPLGRSARLELYYQQMEQEVKKKKPSNGRRQASTEDSPTN